MIRVLVAADDPRAAAALADSLAGLPDLEVLGAAADASSAARLARDLEPEVVVVDARVPGAGARATRELLAARPSQPVVAIGALGDQDAALELLEAGAIAYLFEGTEEAEIEEAIRRAQRGQLSLAAALGTSLVRELMRALSERRLSEADWRRSEARFQGVVELAVRERLFAQIVGVQEEERLRIASDIHDDTMQAMTAASLRLQQLRRHLTLARDLELLGKLEEAVQESIIRLRRLMSDLRPPALDRTGLAAALRELLDRLEEDTGLSASLRDELHTEPPVNVRISLYRIAQEALANVRKHAGAKLVEIEISRQEEGSLVRIGDDGAGFVVEEMTEESGRLGLISMRERARVAGGTFKLESQPGAGTRVTFWLPDMAATDPLLKVLE